jgi:hypothetical protein
MQYSYSEEFRLSLDNSAVPVPAPAVPQSKDGFRYQKSAKHYHGRNFQRPNHDGAGSSQGAAGSSQGAGPSGTAAAITPQDGPSKRGASKGKPYTHPVPELVARPISQCPVKPGPPLNDAARTILRQWGICTYCREARHPRPCPKLLEQGPPKGGKRSHQ